MSKTGHDNGENRERFDAVGLFWGHLISHVLLSGGDDIEPPVNMKLKPHALSPLWPDSSNKTGYGMMGPYDAWHL